MMNIVDREAGRRRRVAQAKIEREVTNSIELRDYIWKFQHQNDDKQLPISYHN